MKLTKNNKSKEDKVKVTNLKNSPKFQIFEFWNGHYTRHTFWSCLIRCANMKWIRWVLLKIQSGHDSVHRRTGGQTDKVIPVYMQYTTSLKRGYNEVSPKLGLKANCAKPRLSTSYYSVTYITPLLWATYYSDVILSAMASQVIGILLFNQSFVQAQIKENIKAPRHCSLWGEFTGDPWIPRTKGLSVTHIDYDWKK